MAPAALSVSVVEAVQISGLETVILPVCDPLEPVETVTLAVARAFCSVVALMTELLPVAVNVAAL